jgi:hypothetical protein
LKHRELQRENTQLNEELNNFRCEIYDIEENTDKALKEMTADQGSQNRKIQ